VASLAIINQTLSAGYFNCERFNSQVVFFILINHSRILNDLNNEGGQYIGSLINYYDLNNSSLITFKNLSKQHSNSVDFAKSIKSKFKCPIK
jgi:hypothetical protein